MLVTIFLSTSEIIVHTKIPTLPALKKAINDIAKSKTDYLTLRKLLDQIGASHKARVIFSTIINPEDSGFLREIKKLKCITGGSERLNNSNLVFITKSGESCEYRLDLPERGVGYVIHIQMQIRCAVHDGVFIDVNDDNGRSIDKLIIGNTHISLARSLRNFSYKADTSTFFTICITDERYRLYVNGELLVSRNREDRINARHLCIGLTGKSGSTLEASLLNVEVWSSDHALLELTENEEYENLAKLKVYIDDNLLEDAIRLLYGNPLILEKSVEESLLKLISDEISSGVKGYRDWLFEKLKLSLSADSKRRLDEICDLERPDPNITVKNVTVEFLENPAEKYSLQRFVRRRVNKTFQVIRDVSFTVYPGDRVGIIGQNGAGKTTLLRTITGLIPISKGEIMICGEYMLLKAGVGMRNELTGRENIYHAGAYLGLWGKELDSICKNIILFSELGEAIDRPFKFYSDGMKARLVFSLATSVKPDVLLLDELLSAGDISFKKKAERRLEEFLGRVHVLLVVSHGIAFVRDKCNKALYLSKVGPSFFGDPEEAISRYLNEVGVSQELASSADHLMDGDSIE